MSQILFIEDSSEYQFLVKRVLSHHDLTMTSDPDEVNNLLDTKHFDLIILDITLPKRDGFSVLQEIQCDSKFQEIPVVCLTGKDQLSDKVTAFSLGADDYIQKPFDSIEFRARVDAKLQKIQRQNRKFLDVGEVRVDLASHRVTATLTGEEIVLTQTEYKILHFMGLHPDIVYSREQILQKVWGDEGAVFDRAVDVHVCALRKKLSAFGVNFSSVPGVGYKLTLKKNPKRKVS